MSRKIFLYVLTVAAIVSVIGLLLLLQNEEEKPSAPTVEIAVVMPHHDIVKDVRREFWTKLARDYDLPSVKKIIVMAPNHFGENQRVITWGDELWRTSRGELKSFLTTDNFSAETGFTLNNNLLKGDHGLVNLIGEIREFMPNAVVAPFLLGQDVAFRDLTPLLNFTEETCAKNNCLILASVDFSHYATLAVAEKQDVISIEHLAAKTIAQPTDVFADSPQALFLIQEFARANNFKWRLFRQTNSAGNNPTITDTTSHVFGWYAP